MKVRAFAHGTPGPVLVAPASAASRATSTPGVGGHISRRRKIAIVAGALLIVIGIAVAAGGLRGGSFPVPQARSATAAKLFAAEPPYVGVACRYSNSTRCGRIGIAVWFRHPPSSVDALLGKTAVTLRNTSRGGRVFTYIGYVHLSAAALGIPSFWTGVPIRYFTLQVAARRGTTAERRTFRVQLHPGWG